MLDGIQAMTATRAEFDSAIREYNLACQGMCWPEVERLRLVAISAMESHLDAVALCYRSVEEAKASG